MKRFIARGAAVGDIDGDGLNDIVSGPFYYSGPDFRQRSAFAEVKDYSIGGYSDHFFSFVRDLNGDSRPDIFSIPIPGQAAVWYENPADENGLWRKHFAIGGVGNESPLMADVDGDGAEELVCIRDGRYGYAKPSESDPTKPWAFIPISDHRGYGKFTHGLGVGDVDSDGLTDLIEKDGWWRQLKSPVRRFEFHAFPFAESGGSQMFVYDFDGDGDNDVLSVQNAHAYGLSWFERRGQSLDDVVFVKHDILGKQPSENPFGLSISQMHAVALADIDGDGVKDIITGKRFWAHGGRDPGAQELPVLYWFRTTRGKNGVEFVPHLINDRVGVGTQLTTADVDGDGNTDVVIGNKLGTFLLRNSGQAETEPTRSTKSRHIVGTSEFSGGVRSTQPLTPEQERETFVLPVGFKAELFSSEPEIAKPMNLAFDSRGRLWVSSSVEYPSPASGDREPRDTIKILEDTDGDGRADEVTTFADKLNIPMGLYPYRDGVICFSIPNILHLRDTDGDDVADERNVLYGPFDTTRDTHGMCNAFTRGYDGWLYACHGFNNQSSVAGIDGHKVTMHSGNTFRMRLDGSRIEHFTHGQVNPFGMALDRWGDHFTADCHTKPITLLLRGGYYESFGKPHDGLGFVPNVMDHLNGSTAIGGIALYEGGKHRGGNFPDVYRGSSFGGNVMTSRINRNSLQRNGASLRVREEPDFLISGDPWFRPVDIQIGPDGAMYVADFYNRIIGHYEVPLDHPGRDRSRGRIWKISYQGTDDRRDAVTVLPDTTKRSEGTGLAETIDALSSPNLTRRMLATDRLVDVFAEQSIPSLRRRWATTPNSDSKIHSLWALHRLGDVNLDDLATALKDPDERVRCHAMQIIGAMDRGSEATVAMIQSGLVDRHTRVRRSAAMASIVHPSESLLQPLLSTMKATPEHDVHLRHALKMALREHLRHPDWFAKATESAESESSSIILELCLAVKSPAAAEFVATNLKRLDGIEKQRLSDFLTFAARYASPQRLPELTAVAESKFASEIDFQEELLRSIHSGLQQRGDGVPAAITEWATRLVKRRFHMKDDLNLPDMPPLLGWRFIADPKSRQKDNIWTVSTQRNSADGQKSSVLLSSFPKGEFKTGVYRSDPFMLPATFQFFMAGHDGFPQQSLQGNNLVRVCDAKSRAVLRSWSPPRNDTAQRYAWTTEDNAGRQVYVELVDGDSANAYAWLAVGRFSVAGLNPNSVTADFPKAADLVTEFSLTRFREPLTQLLRQRRLGRQNESKMAIAFASLESSARAHALAESLAVIGLAPALRNRLIEGLLGGSRESSLESLGEVSSFATAAQQQQMARALLGDGEGLQWLIALVDSGKLSPHLLTEPTNETTVNSIATQEQRQRIDELTDDLPDNDQRVADVIATRKNAYLEHAGEMAKGAEIFRTQCAVCHQVGGQGNVVGPNLDGIGNRGLDRVLEDVFMPNRNIDAAFRASLILTEDGDVITGLVKRTEGARLVMADQKGKEVSIPIKDIAQQKKIPNSPMPANFHESLNESQTSDLLAYLLSLTN